MNEKLRKTDSFADDCKSLQKHARILENKRFLKLLYKDFYSYFTKELESIPGGVCLEIGSGTGFAKQVMPRVKATDILYLPNLDAVFNAESLPFKSGTVSAIFMLNSLHHICDASVFFTEASRCLKTAGKLVAVEPANTLWSRFVYSVFHHEPFDPQSGWKTTDAGSPLASANGALPWILFSRDRNKFESMYPELDISSVQLHTPAAYLLSGGFTLPQLIPSCMFGFVRNIESLFSGLNRYTAMFQTVVVTKKEKTVKT